MSYATLQYMLDWFGENEMINISQRPNMAGNNPAEVYEPVVTEALGLAQEEMDAALMKRYVLPMFQAADEIPGTLRECHAWLAWCRLMAHSPRQGDKPHPECQRWRRWLRDIEEHRESVIGLIERVAETPIHVSQSHSGFDWERF